MLQQPPHRHYPDCEHPTNANNQQKTKRFHLDKKIVHHSKFSTHDEHTLQPPVMRPRHVQYYYEQMQACEVKQYAASPHDMQQYYDGSQYGQSPNW